MMKGSDIMVRCLAAENVSVVFGYPGAAIAPFYDSLSRSGIRHILARTEQGAGHAANGYARVSGGVGVCVATSGPGATNLFTALATAYSDSVPLVAITGQVSTALLGRDVFQEVDTTGAAAPFTKYAYLVKSPDELCRVFKEAFYIANTGRKGPVLIDVPVDVQEGLMEFSYPENVNIRGYKPRIDGHALQVKKVADAICAARRPLVCCGGGVLLSGAREVVRRFCEETSLPAVSTMMGIGVFEQGHPLYYGMLGKTGAGCANAAARESDLLVIIGARVGDRAVSEPSSLESGAVIVHIDIDTAEIGKNVGTTIPLVGDAKRVVSALIEKKPRGNWPDWLKKLNVLRENEPPQTALSPFDPNMFVRLLCESLPPGSVYVADVGQNQIWSAKNFHGTGRFLTTGGMGTMGYSIPAAIGAKLAEPEKMVIAVCGDGAFQMSMNELAVMRQHGAPVKIVIINNNSLGMVSEIQRQSGFDPKFAVSLGGGPDYGLIAAAYGIKYGRVDSTVQTGAAIAQMLADGGPYLLECVIGEESI